MARPRHVKPCVVELFSGMTFADFSPKMFSYAPPAACAGPWQKVVFSADFSVSAGRQYDRTANIWIGGANVYFGTTAEPSQKLSPSWHVERDLTDYSALFSKAQAGEADLGNLVNSTYTGVITGSARLEFYPAAECEPAPRTADVVLPLSAGPTGGTVSLTTPSSRLARSFTLPRNIERAVLDVYAQNQAGDEFFYTCVPSDVAGELQSCGATAFRETEITIDGQPAGVAPVYPWIFTGGIDPYLWRPIPGVQTLEFVPYRVDLTPFAALLSDGNPHEVALSVFNADNSFSTTASLLLYLDPGRKQVSGALTTNTLSSAPSPVVGENLSTGSGGTISGTVDVRSSRSFTLAGYVDTSHGRVSTEIVQDIHFLNHQKFNITAQNYLQDIAQQTQISSVIRTRGEQGVREVSQQLHWPLALQISYVVNADNTSAQTTTVRQQYDSEERVSEDGAPAYFRVLSNSVSPTDTLSFDATGNLVGTQGQASTQRYFAADSTGACYSRSLTAKGGVLTGIKDGLECGY